MTEHTDDGHRYLVISSDTHAGPPSEMYRDYVDPQYRDAFDEDLAAKETMRSVVLEQAVGGAAQKFEAGLGGRDGRRRHARLLGPCGPRRRARQGGHRRRGDLPRRRRPRRRRVGSLQRRAPELGRARRRAGHGRSPRPQPMAGGTLLAESRTPLRCRDRPHPPRSRRCRRRDAPGGEGRVAFDDDPDVVGRPSRVSRPGVRAGLGHGRGARPRGQHPLGRCVQGHRPGTGPRTHLRDRGLVVGGPSPLGHDLERRLRPPPGPSSRHHRGRGVVAARHPRTDGREVGRRTHGAQVRQPRSKRRPRRSRASTSGPTCSSERRRRASTRSTRVTGSGPVRFCGATTSRTRRGRGRTRGPRSHGCSPTCQPTTRHACSG